MLGLTSGHLQTPQDISGISAAIFQVKYSPVLSGVGAALRQMQPVKASKLYLGVVLRERKLTSTESQTVINTDLPAFCLVTVHHELLIIGGLDQMSECRVVFKLPLAVLVAVYPVSVADGDGVLILFWMCAHD